MHVAYNKTKDLSKTRPSFWPKHKRDGILVELCPYFEDSKLGMGNVTLLGTLYLVCLQWVAGNCGTLVGLTERKVASLWSLVTSH